MTDFVQQAWFGHQHHVREDAACNSPHPSPMLSGEHFSRQLSQPKRKRADTLEPVLKRRKTDIANPGLSASDVSTSSALPGSTMTHVSQAHVDSAASVVPPDTAINQVSIISDVATLSPIDTTLGVASLSNTLQTPGSLDTQSSVTLDAAKPEMMETIIVEAAPVFDPHAEVKARNKVHDRISLFINTNILLKHKELRLIETEIAKCQIALEQLRRCHAIPFPGQPCSSAPIENIITGTGPALQTTPGLPQPSMPSPFGVTDGPYTRHYAQWLIQDTTFDATPVRVPRTTVSTPIVAGRKTRNLEEPAVPKTKRASTSMFLQLPTNGHMFRDNKNRLIVRNNDGDWVKVVCKQCGKADSANLQGFTNHTRIAHQTLYTKHDDAVKECGQPLNEEEKALVDSSAPTLLANEEQQPAPSHPLAIQTPLPRTPSFASPLPTGKPILSAMLQGPSRQSVPAQQLQTTLNKKPRPKPIANVQAAKPSSADGLFVPSQYTPGLSSLLKKRGTNINLHRLVTSSQQKIDLDQIEPAEPDDETSPSPPKEPTGVSRMPARVPAEPKTAHPETPGVDTPMVDTPMAGQVLSFGSASNSMGYNAPESSRSSMSEQSSSIVDVSSTAQTSPHVSPRVSDFDPGMVTDHGEDEDVDFTHVSDHGDDSLESTHNTHVRVKGIDVDHEDEHMHSFSNIPESDTCAAPTSRSSGFFVGFQAETGVASSEKKKKRGRPRKSQP